MLPNINNTKDIEKKEKKEKKGKKNRPIKLKTSLKFCSICFEELQDASSNYAITQCKHIFCTSCLLKYSKYNNKRRTLFL